MYQVDKLEKTVRFWTGTGLNQQEAAGGWNRDVQFQHQTQLCEGIHGRGWGGGGGSGPNHVEKPERWPLDRRAEPQGGGRKGRGVYHVDFQEGGVCQIMEHDAIVPHGNREGIRAVPLWKAIAIGTTAQ